MTKEERQTAAPRPRKRRRVEVGDRVVLRASPDPTVRTCYIGDVIAREGNAITVAVEGYGSPVPTIVNVLRGVRFARAGETPASVYDGAGW